MLYVVDGSYVRQGRIMVSAQNLAEHTEWFDGILNPGAVLAETR